MPVSISVHDDSRREQHDEYLLDYLASAPSSTISNDLLVQGNLTVGGVAVMSTTTTLDDINDGALRKAITTTTQVIAGEKTFTDTNTIVNKLGVNVIPSTRLHVKGSTEGHIRLENTTNDYTDLDINVLGDFVLTTPNSKKTHIYRDTEIGIVSLSQSNNSSSGSLIVHGGTAIKKNLNVSGNCKIESTTPSTTASTGGLQVSGGLGVGNGLNVEGPIQYINNTNILKIWYNDSRMKIDSNNLTISINKGGIEKIGISNGVTDISNQLRVLGGWAIVNHPVYSTAAELNYLSSAVPGTASAIKAIVLDASRNITNINDITLTGHLSTSTHDLFSDLNDVPDSSTRKALTTTTQTIVGKKTFADIDFSSGSIFDMRNCSTQINGKAITTSTYTLLNTDHFLLIDTIISGGTTITLPKSSGPILSGQIILIKNIGTNYIHLLPENSSTYIDEISGSSYLEIRQSSAPPGQKPCCPTKKDSRYV